MTQFLPRPRPVTEELEKLCLAKYPGLNKDPFYRRFMEYILFSTWHDETYPERLVITQQLIWKMKKVAKGHKSLCDLLCQFEKDTGIALNTGTYNRYKGQATTIDPEIDPFVKQALYRNFAAPVSERTIYLSSGKKVSQRSRKRDQESAAMDVRKVVSDCIVSLNLGQEQTRLLNLLNGSNSRYTARKIKDVDLGVKQFLGSLHPSSEVATRYRDYSLTVLDALEYEPPLIYKPSSKTSRVHAISMNSNGLPRKIRKLLLTSIAEGHPGCCVELDLCQAQLAITARRWNLIETSKQLHECAEAGTSIWPVFLAYCDLDETFKPVIKIAVYSICYGMGKSRLKKQFLEGCVKGVKSISGVGDEDIWSKFLTNPMVKELFEAREKAATSAQNDGGARDAFNNWIATLDENGNLDVPSILASTAQSWEQYIMYAMLPVLERDERLHILSWLHDGLTLYCSDKNRLDARVQEICSAVDARAKGEGIVTRLISEPLVIEELRDDVRKIIEGNLECCSPSILDLFEVAA